jgi:PAS domain S-box-containing protein
MRVEDKKTLLLVEDEVIIAMLKQKELEKYGYNALTVNTGEKAVDLFKEENNINLILMDIDLGRGIDGTEAAELILKNRDVPVVFMSSHTEPKVVEKTEKITSYGYVVKSSSITVLDASIKMAFKLHKAYKMLAKELIARIKLEEKFKDSEKRLLTWLGHSPVCTEIIDLDLNLQYMSTAGIEGLKIDDITQFYGKPYPLYFYPESFRNIMTKNLIKVRETGEVITQEGSVVDMEGNELWFHSTIVPVNDVKGRIDYIMVVSRDTTDRKHAEDKFKKSQYYLTKAQEIGKIGTWEADFQTTKQTWTDETYKIFDVPLGTKIDNEFFLNYVHPDDRDYVNEKWNAGLNNKPYDIEHRIIVNNKVKWIRVKAEIAFDKTGNPIKAIGFNQDITARKLREEAVELSMFSVHNSRDAMYLTGPDARFIQVSDSACKALGYSKEELLTMSVPDIAPDFPVDELSAHWEDLRKRGSFLIETTYLRKDKTTFPVEVSVNYIKFNDKEYNCAFAREITERKQIEEDFKNIFHLSPDMVAVCTTEGKFLKVNPACEKILGYTQKELLDTGWSKLVHPDDVERTNEEVENQLKGNSVVNFVNRYRCKDGSYKTLEWQATFAKKGIVLATARDITDRK